MKDYETCLSKNGFYVGWLPRGEGLNYLESVASTLGKLKKSQRDPSASFDELLAVAISEANPNSQSSRHGLGKFPLHTDDAASITPGKYIFLYNSDGGHLANTLLLDTREICQSATNEQILEMKEAVFYYRNGNKSFLSSIFDAKRMWFRFDENITKPTGKRAKRVLEFVAGEIKSRSPVELDWRPNQFLIIDNHRCLHGRSSASTSLEAVKRKLIRIIVEDNYAAPI